MFDYIIQSARAQMPASCWGSYRYCRLGVLEVRQGVGRVSMISDRARGVVRVVQTWERLYQGSADRCAYARAHDAAEDLVERLYAEQATAAARETGLAAVREIQAALAV